MSNQQQAEKFSIKVSEPSEFPNLIKGGLITSYELMEKISELFTAVYKDFAGCYICPANNGFGFMTKLYFCPPAIDNAAPTYAFDVTTGTSSPTKGLMAGLNSLQKRSSQRLYTITQHGREGLSDFFSFPKNRQEPDWKGILFEEQQSSNINAGVYAVVVGIDINKLLAAIYGNEENGEYLQYQLTPIRPLGQATNSPNSSLDWILSLQRIGMKELNKVSRKVGIVQNGGIPMVPRHN